jgi:membrane protein
VAPSKTRTSSRERLTPRTVARDLGRAFGRHDLLTYAAAIAFQGFVALVPLSLLLLALLGVLGMDDVWRDSLAPAIQGRVSPSLFHALDRPAKRIVASHDPGLVAFATLLSLWYLMRAVRAVMEALNRIHDLEETRSWWRQALVALALAFMTGACLVGAALVLAAAPRVGGPGAVVLSVGRWIMAVVLLLVLVGVLVRVAPAEHPEARWASVGSLFIVAAWLVASLLFRLWIEYVADLRSPTGTLTGLLVATSYLYVSAAVFLVGTQLDELLRRETHGHAKGVWQLVRTAAKGRA